jgi:hypothetical protein
MARSFWIGTLVGVLACTAPGLAAVVPQERIVTLRETGKPALKCRVLKCWIDKDGCKICEVQAVDGGERLTIVEKKATGDGSSSGGAKAPVTQVYHWEGSDTPPKGAPGAPPSAIVVGVAVPAVSKAASTTPPAAKPTTPAVKSESKKTEDGVITLKATATHPELKCRLMKEWTDKDGSKVTQLQVIATGEIMTMTEPHAGSAARPSGMSRFFGWGSKDTSKSESAAPMMHSETISEWKPTSTASKERLLKIMEANSKQPLTCRVLKEWKEKDGSKGSQLQVVATGELMSMTEPRPGTGMTRVFHWGSQGVAPTGAPVPPPSALVVGVAVPVMKPAESKTEGLSLAKPMPSGEPKLIRLPNDPAPVKERLVKIMEAGSKQPLTCRVLKEWTTKDGKACQLQVVATGELMSMTAPHSGNTRVFHWGPQGKPPTGAPVPPPSAVVVSMPVPVVKPAEMKTASRPDLKPPVTPELKPAPVASKTAPVKERLVKIMEAGSKQPLTCRVLKEWTTRDGKACQLQVVATGELMSMTAPHSGDTRVFHWGPQGKPPTGAPVPPPDAVVFSMPVSVVKPAERKVISGSDVKPAATTELNPALLASKTVPAKTEPAKTAVPKDQIVTLTEKGSKYAQKCRLLKEWTTKDGSHACQLQVIETGEMMSMTETRTGSDKSVNMRLFPWGAHDTPPAGAPVAPPDAVVYGTPAPAPKQPLVKRVFSSSHGDSNSSTTPANPATSSSQAKSQNVAKSDATPAKDYGKVEAWKPNSQDYHLETVAQPAPAATALMNPALNLPPAPVSTPPVPEFHMELTSRPSLPMAKATANDPISQPQAYVKTPVPESVSTIPPPPPAGMPETPPMPGPVTTSGVISSTIIHNDKTDKVVAAPKKPVYTRVEEKAPARESLWGMLTGRHPEPAETATVVKKPEPAMVVRKTEPMTGPKKTEPMVQQTAVHETVEPRSNVPMGMGSVVAAGNPAVNSVSKPIGKMVVMDGQSEMKPVEAATMPGTISIPVTAPNAFTMAMGAPPGMSGPMMPPGPVMMPGAPAMPAGTMMAQAAPPGMGNAFTTTGSSRPIPAEYGMAETNPNAFEHPGMSMPGRPAMAMMAGYYPYPMPMPMPMMPAAMPMAMAQAPVQASHAGELIATLHGAALPSEREMIVEQLSAYDWRSHPQVVTALMDGAKNDPAATVRASCVRALAQMKVNTIPAVQTVQALKDDKDVRVRQEVQQALAIMAH